MKVIIRDYLAQARFGEMQSYKNMAVVPLVSKYTAVLECLTLDEALNLGVIEVRETSRHGTVPEILLANKAEKGILILDGEELAGAKQNRIVNTTILVEARATILLPVSCVEQGRWSYGNMHFHSEERMMSPDLRAAKSRSVHACVKDTGRHWSDQAEVWGKIEEKAERLSAVSPSMDLGFIHEKEAGSIQEYADRFQAIEGQVGALFLLNGEVVGLDSFGNQKMLAEYFRKLVESCALDAVDRALSVWDDKVDRGEAESFFCGVMLAPVESHAAVGIGTDVRIDSDQVNGAALVVDSRIVHLSVFPKAKAGDRGSHQGLRMAPLSRRGSRY